MFRTDQWLVFIAALAVGVMPLPRATAFDEEEEVNPKTELKKIVVDDDTPGGAAAVPDLVRAATSAKEPDLKSYYRNVAIACDRLTLENRRSVRVLLLPYVWEKDREKFRANPDGFGVAVLDENDRPGEPRAVLPKTVRAVTPYEQFAILESDRLLSSTDANASPRLLRLAAVERALTAVLFRHQSAVDANTRRGPHWEPFKSALVEKLLAVRRERVSETAEQKEWDELGNLVAKYSELYRNQPQVVIEFVTIRLAEAADRVKSDEQPDLERARQILNEFERQVPNSDNPLAADIRTALAEKARKKLADIGSDVDSDRARRLLNDAKLLNPDDPAVLEKQRELRSGYRGLIVGVQRMPRLMSPATAREDSERMAVELLFEGLLEPLPDEQLGRVYRPTLAIRKPQVRSLSREFELLSTAGWGRTEEGTFDAADLVATVQLMKADRTLPSAEAADWLDEVIPDREHANRVRIGLNRPHPDPRQLLAFKVLPGKYLAGKKKAIDDRIGSDSFARSPFGTGPFRLAPGFVPSGNDQPVAAITFVPNPTFGRRQGRGDQPELSEVQFVPVVGRTPQQLARELSNDLLHIVTDVPTADLETYRTAENVKVVTAARNRRIHLLAVNHTVAALQSQDVRRGLSLAIDRESILDEVYRAGTKHHRALTGPYPPGSWLAPPTTSPPEPLYNRDLAAGKLRGAKCRLVLLYPNDDIRAEASCKRIARQVGECGSVEVVPEGVSPVELHERVERQGRYELAYMTFDYPDIWHAHAVAALLDPTAAVAGGRNYFRYMAQGSKVSRADEALAEALAEVVQHRDPDGQVKRFGNDVWERFLETTPFIPLWQLDRHTAVAECVQVFFDGRPDPVPFEQLDPIRLFSNVSRWKLVHRTVR